MEIYQFFHEKKVELSISSIIIGTVLSIISAGAILTTVEEGGFFSSIKDAAGNWIYWIIILGVVILLLGLFYFVDFIAKRKEFFKLYNEKSKSKFIKELDRIEELAWRLHPKYEELVIDKKKQMKIR